jgi:sulfite reductase alpha subunit-like flavoprotein
MNWYMRKVIKKTTTTQVPPNMEPKVEEVTETFEDKPGAELNKLMADMSKSGDSLFKKVQDIFDSVKEPVMDLGTAAASTTLEADILRSKIAELESAIVRRDTEILRLKTQPVVKDIPTGTPEKYHFLYHYDGSNYAVGPFASEQEVKPYKKAFMRFSDEDHLVIGTVILVDMEDGDLTIEDPDDTSK